MSYVRNSAPRTPELWWQVSLESVGSLLREERGEKNPWIVGRITSEMRLRSILEMKLCPQVGNSSQEAHMVIILDRLSSGSSAFHILISVGGLTRVAPVRKFPLCVVLWRV